MPTILAPPRKSRVAKTRTLAQFAFRNGPVIWQRLAEDRKRNVEPSPGTPDFAAWTNKGIHAAWIGHSTVLLSVDGFTILTDPVFSTRIGVGIGPVTVGMKRIVHPAAKLTALPTPDLILLSHAHMDHFDLPSLRALENPRTTIVTAANTSDLLRVKGYRSVRELQWGDECRIGPATIRAFEVNHWGARVRTDLHRGYNGYLIETGRYRIVFGGDTAYTESFRSVRAAKPVDLAIMPIGAYNPWIHAHCNPEQALTMASHAGAEFVLPVHHQTFKLSSEPYREPIQRLVLAAGSSPERIPIREIGDEFHFVN